MIGDRDVVPAAAAVFLADLYVASHLNREYTAVGGPQFRLTAIDAVDWSLAVLTPRRSLARSAKTGVAGTSNDGGGQQRRRLYERHAASGFDRLVDLR